MPAVRAGSSECGASLRRGRRRDATRARPRRPCPRPSADRRSTGIEDDHAGRTPGRAAHLRVRARPGHDPLRAADRIEDAQLASGEEAQLAAVRRPERETGILGGFELLRLEGVERPNPEIANPEGVVGRGEARGSGGRGRGPGLPERNAPAGAGFRIGRSGPAGCPTRSFRHEHARRPSGQGTAHEERASPHPARPASAASITCCTDRSGPLAPSSTSASSRRIRASATSCRRFLGSRSRQRRSRACTPAGVARGSAFQSGARVRTAARTSLTVSPDEQPLAGQHLEEHHAERPDVGALVDGACRAPARATCRPRCRG